MEYSDKDYLELANKRLRALKESLKDISFEKICADIFNREFNSNNKND